jgi:hypothetical protein
MNRFQRFEDIDTSGEQPLPRPPSSVTVIVWDIGPQLPADVPQRPDSSATPAQQEDYQADISAYVAAVFRYKRERQEFEQKYKGPVEIQADSVSAREFKERSPERYLDFLPSGVKPGPHVGANRIRIGGGHD